jgi:ABC-type antimicrobial peptide transport system permease subunit
MAIRLAVGAASGRVLRMVLGDAMRLATIGVVTGIAAAALAGRSVASLLYGTSPADPVVLGSAGAIMLVVAAAATLIPAITASRANPNELLR